MNSMLTSVLHDKERPASKESSIQDHQFVVNSVQSHIFLVLTFWRYWHAAQVLVLLKNLLTAGSCSWVSSLQLSWESPERSGDAWKKKLSFMTEGSSVSCWHPPEVQTEWFLADFFSRITADCRLPLWVWPWFEQDFCQKAFRLKRVHANHLISVSVCLGMWLKRLPYLSRVCHSHRRSGRKQFSRCVLQTPFSKDAFRIDSVLGRTPCRGCQMPGFAFMQANYLNDSEWCRPLNHNRYRNVLRAFCQGVSHLLGTPGCGDFPGLFWSSKMTADQNTQGSFFRQMCCKPRQKHSIQACRISN